MLFPAFAPQTAVHITSGESDSVLNEPIYILRNLIFCTKYGYELPTPDGYEQDEFDEYSYFLGLYYRRALVRFARIIVHPDPSKLPIYRTLLDPREGLIVTSEVSRMIFVDEREIGLTTYEKSEFAGSSRKDILRYRRSRVEQLDRQFLYLLFRLFCKLGLGYVGASLNHTYFEKLQRMFPGSTIHQIGDSKYVRTPTGKKIHQVPARVDFLRWVREGFVIHLHQQTEYRLDQHLF